MCCFRWKSSWLCASQIRICHLTKQGQRIFRINLYALTLPFPGICSAAVRNRLLIFKKWHLRNELRAYASVLLTYTFAPTTTLRGFLESWDRQENAWLLKWGRVGGWTTLGFWSRNAWTETGGCLFEWEISAFLPRVLCSCLGNHFSLQKNI